MLSINSKSFIKVRSTKLCTFISRLQELSAFLEEYLPDAPGQVTTPFPADEIINIIYYSIPTMWKNKIIEQGFNNAYIIVKDMTDFFRRRVENLIPKEVKKKTSAKQLQWKQK